MTRPCVRVLLAFALAVPGGVAAQQPPPSPASPVPGATPDCAVFSIEGIHFGMTAAEAEAAVPALVLNARGDGMATHGAKGQPRLDVRLRAGRVDGIRRSYDGMSQAGVRRNFLDQFGPPTEHWEGATPPSRPGLEGSQDLIWRAPDCNIEVKLHIESEQGDRDMDSATAIAYMRPIVRPVAPATGTADVKF